jgi:hypothetical protein
MTALRGNPDRSSGANSADDGFGGDLDIDGFPLGMDDDIDPANEPMDRVDLRILTDLLAIYDTVDPMPEMLPDLVLFGLNAHNLDAEYARLVESELAVSGASGTRSVEHARRVTFASDNLTVMVVVNPQRDGSVRLDGWAAPGGRLHAELRVGDDTLTAECDESGRFVFDAVPAGPAQLVLHPTLDSDPSLTLPVVTPAVHL